MSIIPRCHSNKQAEWFPSWHKCFGWKQNKTWVWFLRPTSSKRWQLNSLWCLLLIVFTSFRCWSCTQSRSQLPPPPNTVFVSPLSAFGSLPCLAQTCPCNVKSTSCIDLSVSEPRPQLRPRLLLKAPTLAEMEEMNISEVRKTHRESLVLILVFFTAAHSCFLHLWVERLLWREVNPLFFLHIDKQFTFFMQA